MTFDGKYPPFKTDSSGNILVNISGSIPASTVTITDDNATNATMYPTWVTANTGNLPLKVSSTKISFNPSTANLTTSTFTGDLIGKVNGLTVTTSTGTLTINGTLATSGVNSLTLTTTGTTNSTLPSGSHTLAGLDVAQTWAAIQTFANQYYFATATLSVASNKIAWNLTTAQVAAVTISANALLQIPTNMKAGAEYLLFINSSAGAQLLFEGSGIYVFNINAIAPTLVNGVTILKFYSDGTSMYGTVIDTGYSTSNPISVSAPNTWYAARLGYSGTTGNVTAVTDFGSNAITGTKVGTGNIIISNINSIASLDFGSANSDRSFSLGTPNISNFMTAGASSLMAVINITSSTNAKLGIWGWETVTDTFYFTANPSVNTAYGFLFDTTNSEISGTTPTLTNNVVVLIWVKNAGGTNSKLYANGVEIGSLNQPETPDNAASLALFGRANSEAAFQGVIGDFAIWARAITTQEVADITLQMRSIYGAI